MADRVDYLQKLTDDLITQFRRQPNTRALMSAIARQLQDLYKATEQLNELRWLSKAEGKQLDGIGDIVVLSRTDAAILELGKTDANAIDDTTYRKYLYYKMFLNTSTGTRREIMKALRFFWNEAPLYYSEDAKYPATIFVDTPELAPDVPIEGLLEAPIVKPAGVRFIVRIHTKTHNEEYKIRIAGVSTVKKTSTQIEEFPHLADMAHFRLIITGLSLVKITETKILENEKREVSQHGIRVIGLSGVKSTITQMSESTLPAVNKSLRTAVAPLWEISRTDTGDYAAVVGSVQHHNRLSTVKITNTPLAEYGGD